MLIIPSDPKINRKVLLIIDDTLYKSLDKSSDKGFLAYMNRTILEDYG
jgi:hypothetical protein